MNKDTLIIGGVLFLIITGLIIFYNMKETLEEGYDFEIHFFNAGKADAILLSKDNKYIMIDTGEEDLAYDILKYFQEKNITRLEYLIITHFDKDHVGSASQIIDSIEIGKVLQSNVSKESEYYTNYVNSLQKKNITPLTISNNKEFSLSNLSIVVNGPGKKYDSNQSNNSSLIVSIIHEKNKFLFMGDSQNARIKDFLENNKETYNFLKVPYHGRTLKRLEELVSTKNIKYAVITSSNTEKESEETLEVLKKYNIKTYLTRKGSITVLSDGSNIKIKQ